MDAGKTFSYKKNKAENGFYCFVIDDQVDIDLIELDTRDGFGLNQGVSVQVTARWQAQGLCMEVP
jgi:hypothetical protein